MLQKALMKKAALRNRVAKARRKGGRTPASRPPLEDCRLVTLQELLSSPHFRASERNKRFLKFVVEETVAGRSDRIKAFTIAVDVFGRGVDFDASADPIVRIAAGQLRKSLGEYYTRRGVSSAIQISLPLGGYVPSFVKRKKLIPRLAERFASMTPRHLVQSQSGAVGAVSALFLAGAAIIYGFAGAQFSDPPPKPVLVIDNVRTSAADPASEAFAQMLTQALMVKMGNRETVRILGVGRDEKLAAVISNAREVLPGGGQLYQLLATVQADGGDMRVYWHLMNAVSKETYHSSLLRESIANGDDGSASEAISLKISDVLFGSDRFLPASESASSILK